MMSVHERIPSVPEWPLLVAFFFGAGLLIAACGGDSPAPTTPAPPPAPEPPGDADADRAVLEAFYDATDGPNWVNNENWLTDVPLGDWYGVDTDATGRVVSLALVGGYDRGRSEWIPHGLKGPIPPELGELTELTSLDLFLNYLAGPIPPELGELTNLKHLTLSQNELAGSIPPELGELTNLTSLSLSANELTGPIPPEFGDLANLTHLELSWNELTGPIPPELGNLTKLERLFLDGNPLSGPIPPELLKLQRLMRLGVGENVCAPADPAIRAWLVELNVSLYPCQRRDERLLPRALMREDGNGLALTLPDDLHDFETLRISDPSVVAASVADGRLRLLPLTSGSAEVEIVPSGGGVPAIAGVSVRTAVGTFGIDIVMEEPAPLGYADNLVEVADWWSAVLDGTEWRDRRAECLDHLTTAAVDELLIYAGVDFETDLVGYAKRCSIVSGLPVGGEVWVNPEGGAGRGLVAHEIGHLLGLAGFWPSHLVTKDREYFVGPRAVEVYRRLGGDSSLPGVPLVRGHWDLVPLRVPMDLMGPWAGPEVRLTFAALADAGYTVDMTQTPIWGNTQSAVVSLADDILPMEPHFRESRR